MRKYPAEFMFEFRSVDRFVFRAADLYELHKFVSKELIDRVRSCPIYLICKRPRISLVPESIQTTPDILRLQIQFKLEGVMHSKMVEIERRLLLPEGVSFEVSSYPHRELISRNQDGLVIAETLFSNFVPLLFDLDPRVSALEVVYVGQGVRPSASKRLVSHSTMQKILTRVNANEPDTEVFILLYKFSFHKHAVLGVGIQSEIQGSQARSIGEQILNYRPTPKEQVDLIEASLISYFQPEFNEHYRVFPNRKHSILKTVYNLDLAVIGVLLDNSNIANQRLYSKAVAPHHIHTILTDFRQLEGKPSLFGK